MVFSSIPFLFLFLPAFLAVYYLSPRRLQNPAALAASLAFYAWGAPRLVFYLAAACALDYGAGRLLAIHDGRPNVRRRIAAAAVSLNVAFLLYFKYANFFVAELNGVVQAAGGVPWVWTEVALPIGISFFTFHRVSYLMDVYRRVTEPARSYADYLLYVVLFPQLIAGPIVRYRDVAGDLTARSHGLQMFFDGLCRFFLGLAKKILIANVLGETADKVFAIPAASVPGAFAWLGILAYAFQIYFDFSGYSDMAIGLAAMIGIRFPENFRDPYAARSITEFWRRWHISLSTFMRDYVYIPLGGGRAGPIRTYVNLWIVFLLSGLWHGASWNFVLWGAYHGLFLVCEKRLGLRRLEKIPGALAVGATFLVAIFGWVLFRAPDLPFALRFASRLLGWPVEIPPAVPTPWQAVVGARGLFTLAVAAFFSFLPAWGGLERVRDHLRTSLSPDARNAWSFVGLLLLGVLSVAYLSGSAFNPFIYFRF